MPLNLDGLQHFIEGEMVDSLLITRDPSGTTDDDFDSDTGELTEVGRETVYEGAGLLIQLNVFPTETTQGAEDVLITDYELHIPLDDSNKLQVMDRVVVVSSLRDPHLGGSTLWVHQPEYDTFAVSQKARVSLKTPRIIQ